MRSQRELILRLAGDAVLAPQVLRRFEHAARHWMVAASGRDAAAADAVRQRRRVPAQSEAQSEGVVLGLAHALGPTGDDHVADARLYAHRGIDHRLQAGAAAPVELGTRDGDWQARVQRRDAADRRSLAVRIALSEDHIIDVGNSGAAHELGHDGRREIGGRNVLQRAAVAPDRRPQGLADDRLAHHSAAGMDSRGVAGSSAERSPAGTPRCWARIARRMILPFLVLGSTGTKCSVGAKERPTLCTAVAVTSSSGTMPSRRTTNATTR